MTSSGTASPRVLVADDQPHIREALAMLLGNEGFLTTVVASPETVMTALLAQRFDLVLMDLNYARDTTSGREGADLLKQIRSIDAGLPVVAMTGWATLDLAIEMMKTGVCDFIQKPWDNTRLVSTIRREVDAGRERRRLTHEHDRDAATARDVQYALLPQGAPDLPGWTIAADWRPANGVGGDYFDLIPLDTSRIGICIADVVGKGVSAALLMSNLQAVMRATVRDQVAPAEVCVRVNRAMCAALDAGRFITLFYGVLDANTNTLSWSNAGHNPALVYQREEMESLSDGGMVLGLFPDAIYEQRTTQLTPGARIVLYTDGITEAEDEAGSLFSDESLAALIRQHGTLTAQPMRDAIFSHVTDFCRGHFRDDATLIVLAAD